MTTVAELRERLHALVPELTEEQLDQVIATAHETATFRSDVEADLAALPVLWTAAP